MSSEEQVLSDYQANRRKLEDEEDLVKRVDRKGQHLIEQAFYDLDVTARQSQADPQALAFIRQEIMRAQETYDETIVTIKKQLAQKAEDNELAYREKMKQYH
ncbi:hypothetical protein ACSFB8_06980 [Enterococcus faecalis]|jgi:hypothetical protein